MLDYLDSVHVQKIALQIKATLEQSGPQTIASIISKNKTTSGLEELVTYIRIAKAVNATVIDSHEYVNIQDKNGVWLRACLPTFLLSADMFPTAIEDIII